MPHTTEASADDDLAAIAAALPEPGSDPAGWVADQLFAIIRLYLREEHRDLKMVVGALHLLAVRDPHLAQDILDTFELVSILRGLPRGNR